MKVLHIVESAYRATVEEQDDTVLWLTHVIKGAGAQVDVLLRGNAVNYAVPGQQVEGLAIGGWRQTQPPRIAQDLAGLIAKGVRVFALTEDLAARSLLEQPMAGGVEPLLMKDLAHTLQQYQRVWHW
jgi:sulfur transfer complex TusBCD TusB component (DsrH family)